MSKENQKALTKDEALAIAALFIAALVVGVIVYQATKSKVAKPAPLAPVAAPNGTQQVPAAAGAGEGIAAAAAAAGAAS